MWNFERKWAKNNFLICRALWGNGVVWVCLRGGGDADWVSCWLSWLTVWLNQWIMRIVDRVRWFGWWLCMFSLRLGVQWVGWLYFDLMARGGCVTGWLGMGLSQCVCGAGWVLVRSVDCVCVCGWVGDRIGWYWWWLGMFSLGLGVQWVGWLYILIVVGGGWVTGWWGMGVSQMCVVLTGCWLGQWIVCV